MPGPAWAGLRFAAGPHIVPLKQLGTLEVTSECCSMTEGHHKKANQ